MNRKLVIGFIGILGVWFGNGIALPLVNILDELKPEQLMVARGVVTAVLAFLGLIFLTGKFIQPEPKAMLVGLFFALACLGLYKGVRTWGVSPTIVVVTATPVVNFLICWFQRRNVPLAAILSLCILLVGVVLALPWRQDKPFIWLGLTWSVFGTVMNGFFYWALHRGKEVSRLLRCFWQAVGVAVVGFMGVYGMSWSGTVTMEWGHVALLLVFVFTGGILYFLANILAFDNLPTEVGSVLAQGETPIVIFMSWLILGEVMVLSQWIGVGIALCGTWYLTQWLSKQTKKE